MKCKNCAREIPDNSVFCMWCAQPQIRFRKDPFEISIPEPKRLPSGMFRVQLRREGISITEDTPEKCREKARVARRKWQIDEAAGLHAPPPEKLLLKDALDTYIASKSNLLSPATIRSYKSIRHHRFQGCMDWDLKDDTLNWQMAINHEVTEVLPQTVNNAWHLIATVFKFVRLDPPRVTLPKKLPSSHAYLRYDQIPTFIDAVKGTDVELGALLALSSLRFSELAALQPTDISPDGKTVSIHAVRVLNSDNQMVRIERNKTDSSTREVKVAIPRLQELLKEAAKSDAEYIFDWTDKKMHDHIDKICRKAGLPEVGVHGLRHSFASLGYHLDWKKKSAMEVGGWSNSVILDSVYTHNADLDEDLKRMEKFYTELLS